MKMGMILKRLAMYENTRADLKMLLSEGESITPKAWTTVVVFSHFCAIL